jgi:lipoprotein-releasing system permease protein
MADRRANAPGLAARIELATGSPRERPAAPEGTLTRPFAAFEWMIALRYLRARRKERTISAIAIISLIGIALGVAALIIVMSVMNGFRHELLARILGLNGHVIVQQTGGFVNYDAAAVRVKAIPGVSRATPYVTGQVMASSRVGSMGALVRGIRRDDLRVLMAELEKLKDPLSKQTTMPGTLSPGTLNRFGGGETVVVGYRLANRLGLTPGMNINLIAPQGDITPFGSTPRVKTYTIAGTFDIGMSEFDESYIFMPLDEAQAYFNTGDAVSGLEVMLDKPDDAARIAEAATRAAGPMTAALTWQQMRPSLFGALQVERNVMFLILTLIVLVAALNIISGLIMLVKDKSGDIAIMRTMGATRGAMMRVFLIAGTSIGVIGTLTGFIIGVVFCAYIEEIRQGLSKLVGRTLFDPTIYFLSQMPAEMDTGEVIAVVVMALTLSVLATLYPSWRAARLDPVEALRYE